MTSRNDDACPVPVVHTKQITILGLGDGQDGENFALLQINGRRGVVERLIPIDELSSAGTRKKVFKRLKRSGAALVTDRAEQELANRIQVAAHQPSTFRVLTKPGWDKETGIFVLPEPILPAGAEPVHVSIERGEKYVKRLRVGGTESGWRELIALCAGNSRLQLALFLAFVGPLVAFTPLEQVAVQFVGEPEKGKTALLIACGSVWGCHIDPNLASRNGMAESWNNTINNLEKLAAANNHTILLLDETHMKDKLAEIFEAISRLESSGEKGRLTDDDDDTRSWWSALLSTSNLSLKQMAEKARVPFDNSYRGRLIEIPLPADGCGAFETLHGYESIPDFTLKLKQICTTHFGRASRTYLAYLIRRRVVSGVRLGKRIQCHRREFLQAAKAIRENGYDAERARNKLATVYAAARLAQSARVLPHEWRPKAVLLDCLRDHILFVVNEDRADAGYLTPRQRLAQYICDKSHTFVDLASGLPAIGRVQQDRICYITKDKFGLRYLIPDRVFASVVGGEVAARELKVELARDGYLKSVGAGGNQPRFVSKETLGILPDGKRVRAYVLSIAADFVSQSSVAR